MITSKLARHIFIPAAALVAEKVKPTSTDCVCKPSELPIYSTETPRPKTEICTQEQPGVIEQTFGNIRRGLFHVVNELKYIEEVGQSYVKTGLENAECLLDYLQEEENTTPKYGAVAVGGLTGLILGLRGGFFRRTIYASAGALTMAAICYPKEATEYSQIGIAEAKRYAAIAYNFIYGVKKDDPPLALPSLPKLPGSFSEAWDATKSLGKSSPSTVTDKEAEQVNKRELELSSQEIDPAHVVPEAHEIATSKSCHCPIGACMGHHEESSHAAEA